MRKRMWGSLGGLVIAAAVAMPVGAQAVAEPAAESPAATPDKKPDPAALAEAMRIGEIWIEAQRRYRKIPAISAAVVMDQNTVWAKGFGATDRQQRRAATPDTVYSICSISKLFTAVAAMQQWEQGKLRLDEPVTTYLPWAKLADDPRESVPVTLRGLLTHSAGVPRESAHAYWTGPNFPFPNQAEIRAGIAGQHPLYPASTAFQYSNLGITLVGESVEAVSGQPYGAYVQQHILAPLGLADTRPGIPKDLYGGTMAVGWGALDENGKRPEVALFDPAGITPAAGFSSTVNDLARFASWNFRLLGGGKPEVLRASTLRDMQRPHYTSPNWKTTWGLGFAVFNRDGKSIVGHGGSCPGYRSGLMMMPDRKMAVTVMMNAMDDPEMIGAGLGGLIGKRMEAKPLGSSDAGEVPLLDYAGYFDGQPWSADLVMVPWAGGLATFEPSAKDPADDITLLKPLGKDRFRVLDDKGNDREEVVFERDASGKVVGLLQHNNRYRRIRGL